MAESVKQHELSEVVVLDADEQVRVLGHRFFTLMFFLCCPNNYGLRLRERTLNSRNL